MQGFQKVVGLSVGLVMLLAGLGTVVQGAMSPRAGYNSRLGTNWVELRGRVLCADCTLEEQQQLRPIPKTRLYQLNHRQGQVVMEVNPQIIALDYYRLWIRGGDQVFKILSAPENRFKEIVISGVFREYLPTAGTLDLATVSFRAEQD